MAAKPRRIPLPSEDRPPLAVNVFRLMEQSNCQLLPLFPYLHPGAIVPAGAIFRGGAGVDFGHFFHSNTVDEVVLVFGSAGTHVQPGQVYVTSRVHGVTSPLKDDSDPESFQMTVITQRQATGRQQTEGILFRCKKCGQELFRYDYDASPTGSGSEEPYPGFETLAGSLAAAERYNADEQAHTCGSCGHVNRRFPVEMWGWRKYVEQNWTVNQARRSLDAMAAQAPSSAGT